MDVSNLKPGDPVFVETRHGRRLTKVHHITPKGSVRVDGVLYNPVTGCARGSDAWNFTSITPASETEIIQYNREIYVSKVRAECQHITGLTYEQAVEIHKILKGVESNEPD